jgi:hypothetical protein
MIENKSEIFHIDPETKLGYNNVSNSETISFCIPYPIPGMLSP